MRGAFLNLNHKAMSCGCSVNTDKEGNLLDVKSIVDSPQKRQEMAELTYISKEKYVSGDKLSMLRFLHCADEVAFNKAFSKYDVLRMPDGFADSDLQILADLWESGKDKEIGIDVKQTLVTMKVDPRKLATCSVKFV